VSEKFSKKTDHGKWFGAEAKNHEQKENHDPSDQGHDKKYQYARAIAGAFKRRRRAASVAGDDRAGSARSGDG
jgi:hypothetical protein